MIAYIKGKVISVSGQNVILVSGGIGYEVTCSGAALSALSGKEEGEVFTYMSVKEDGVSLYGFRDSAEKNMFLELVSVSGVGPKMGIAILSAMNVNDLAVAIATSDAAALSRIKGCGKKTAERIILELREKMGKIDLPAGKASAPVLSHEDDDAVIALMTLGFNRSESIAAVESAKEAGANGVEQLISLAIRSMNR